MGEFVGLVVREFVDCWTSCLVGLRCWFRLRAGWCAGVGVVGVLLGGVVGLILLPRRLRLCWWFAGWGLIVSCGVCAGVARVRVLGLVALRVRVCCLVLDLDWLF